MSDSYDEYSRETIWGSHDGRELPIKELEDSHILNLLTYIGKRKSRIEDSIKEIDPVININLYEYKISALNRNKSLLKVINEEIDLRGLDIKLVEGGKPLPYKIGGRWYIWKDGDPRPTLIPNSIDFIKPLDGKED